MDGGRPVAGLSETPLSSLQSDVKRVMEIAKAPKKLHSEDKVVVVLAREVFFTDQILHSSTVLGKSTYSALDSDRLNSLEKVVHDAVFPEMSPATFNSRVCPRITSSLSSLCRRRRKFST